MKSRESRSRTRHGWERDSRSIDDSLTKIDQARLTKYGDLMARIVKVQEAKTHLSAILTDVEHGDEVVIARGNVPVARLIPIQESPARELGFVPYRVPEQFDEPLPEDELAAWEA